MTEVGRGNPIDVDELATLIAQRRRETAYARAELEHTPSADHVRLGWWEPHQVYVIHEPAGRRYKVGLTHHRSRRIREHTARGRAVVVATITLANRWAARLVESAVLERTDHARTFGERTSRHGRTEYWSDAVAPPDLEQIAEELARDASLGLWSSTWER